MMNSKCISLTPVENGWIVELPVKGSDPFSQSLSAGIKMAKSIGEDPKLSPPEEDEDEVITKEKGTHIFKTFSEVLSFLKFTVNE